MSPDMNGINSKAQGRSLTAFDGVRNVASVLSLHFVLAAWFVFAPLGAPIWLYFLSTPLVCLIHQRFMSEWFHEAIHFNLVPHRAWNDLLTNSMIGIVLGTQVSSNRALHFAHHGVTTFFESDDPDTARLRALTREDLLRGILLDICGYNAITQYLTTTFSSRSQKRLRGKNKKMKIGWLAGLFVVHGVGIAGTLYVGRFDIYPFFYLTLVGLYPVLNRVRLYGQHARILEDGSAVLAGSEVTRNLTGSLIERIFFNSSVMAYHLEHHLRPHLPFRALPPLVQPTANPNQSLPSCGPVFFALLRGLR